VLTRDKYRSLFVNNPYVDKVFTFADRLESVISELKKQDYDHIVDLHKNLRSFNVRMALHKPTTSFPKLNVEKYIYVNFGINKLPPIHIVDRYFEAVKPLGVQNDLKGLDYFIPESDKLHEVDLPIEFHNGFFAFAIGGQHTTKILPVGKLIEVSWNLSAPIILLGGNEDAKRGDAIVEAVETNIWNSCGKLNLNQSASVIKMAKVVLSNDTGLMHIAAAFKKPIVSVWGNTVPEFGMYPYMPGNECNSIIIEKKLSCRPCSKIGYKKCPKKHFNCMMQLDAIEIAQSLHLLSVL
jgi:ADP-heptose:LPS heptosyltransferase